MSDDRLERHLGIYRQIPADVTFSLIVKELGSGQSGNLRRVRDKNGEEFDLTDPITGRSQHVSLAHLRDRDPDRTEVMWRWGYSPRLPLTGQEADAFLAHQRERRPDLNPRPGARDHLMGR